MLLDALRSVPVKVGSPSAGMRTSLPFDASPPLLGPDNSVLLDFDGTLVDIVERPDAVMIGSTLLAVLRRLAGTFPGRLP